MFKLSHFSAVFPVPNGELLLCNSFMGAVCRIPEKGKSEVLNAIEAGISDLSETSDEIKKLCENGYFVDASLDETGIVHDILELERDTRGFSLILLPHENCNFRCVYCYEKFERNKMERHIVDGIKLFVEKNLSTWGSLAVQWFGGEPLLGKDVIRELSDSFIKSSVEQGVNYTAGMTTNAYLLTKDVARMLLDRKVNRFQITLDGPAGAHNARRHLVNGKGTYETVFNNLVALKSFPDKYIVRLRVNFDVDSIDLIQEWLTEIAPVFASDPRFAISFHPIGKWGGPNDNSLNVCNEDFAKEAKLNLFESAFHNGFAKTTYKDFLSSHGASCYAGKDSSVVIGSNGRLYKCTVAFDDERNHVGWISNDGELLVEKAKWNLWTKTSTLETGKCTTCWFHASCESRTCPLVALDNGTPPCPSSPKEMQDMLELSVYGERLTNI